MKRKANNEDKIQRDEYKKRLRHEKQSASVRVVWLSASVGLWQAQENGEYHTSLLVKSLVVSLCDTIWLNMLHF